MAIRERVIKIGARVIEHGARICIVLPTGCPEGALFRTAALAQAPLAQNERLRIAPRRAAFHSTQSSKPAEDFGVKPMFSSLRAEMGKKEVDFACQYSSLQGNVEIGLPKIAIPFGNLVFKDHVIAKRIPGELRNLPMILMRIVRSMGQYEIGLASRFQCFHPSLDVLKLAREVSVSKLSQLHLRACRSSEEGLS